jgi:hypothetical protein
MATVASLYDNTSHDHKSQESSVSDLLYYKIVFAEDDTLQWDPPAGSPELARALSYHFPIEKGIKSKMQAATRKFWLEKPPGLSREEKQDHNNQPRNAATGNASEKDVSTSSKKEKASPQEVLCNTNGERDARVVAKPSYAEVLKSSAAQDPPHESKGLTKDLTPTAPAQTRTTFRTFLNWDSEVKGFKKKGTKRPYAKDEGAKVTANRGFVCDKHRKQRKKVRNVQTLFNLRVADDIKCDPDKCPHNGQRLNNTKSLAARTPNSLSPHNATLLGVCRGAPKLPLDGVHNSTPSLAPDSIRTTNTLKLGSHNTTSASKNAESTRVSTPQLVEQSNGAGKNVGPPLQEVVEASHNGDTSLATSRDDFLTSVDGMEEGFSPHVFDDTVPDLFDLTDPFNIDASPFSYNFEFNSGADFDNIGVFEPFLPKFTEQSLEPEVELEKLIKKQSLSTNHLLNLPLVEESPRSYNSMQDVVRAHCSESFANDDFYANLKMPSEIHPPPSVRSMLLPVRYLVSRATRLTLGQMSAMRCLIAEVM